MRVERALVDRYAVDLRGADEIIHRQATDIVRGEFDQAATPAQLQVGMMILLFGDEAEAAPAAAKGEISRHWLNRNFHLSFKSPA